MTNWFDTNYLFCSPELGPHLTFSYSSHKAVNEYKEAKALGIDTVPVFLGPVTYLLISKHAKGVDQAFSLLSLLDRILPIYREVITELKAEGVSTIQFDEPSLVLDLKVDQLDMFTKAYDYLESSLSGLNVIVVTYFADVPSAAYKTLTSLSGVTGYGFDLVCGYKTIDLIKNEFPAGKFLFAGLVDGRNVWANDLAASLNTLQSLERVVGKDKLVVSTSCSLLHTAVDLVNEPNLDKELKSWLAFAAQKLLEVNALAEALSGQTDKVFFNANAVAQASRRSSTRVHVEAVRKAADLKEADYRRATNVSARLDAQREKLKLPILPTTVIESCCYDNEIGTLRMKVMNKIITMEEYINGIRELNKEFVKLQEDLNIDVISSGQLEWRNNVLSINMLERSQVKLVNVLLQNDMVQYIGKNLSGFTPSTNGYVQCYGYRCLKPLIIYGDVSRPSKLTVTNSSLLQKQTTRRVKAMLTGPVNILNWCFVRDDQARSETSYQIALAINDEVMDLEKAGITVIQIDGALLRECLPLRKSEHAFYLNWAVRSFRMTNFGVEDTTQIHTHLCFSNVDSIISSIIDMDADVITLEYPPSTENLEKLMYGAGIGPGLFYNSIKIPSKEDIVCKINKMVAAPKFNCKFLWVIPGFDLKSHNYEGAQFGLKSMVAAAKFVREQFGNSKRKRHDFEILAQIHEPRNGEDYLKIVGTGKKFIVEVYTDKHVEDNLILDMARSFQGCDVEFIRLCVSPSHRDFYVCHSNKPEATPLKAIAIACGVKVLPAILLYEKGKTVGLVSSLDVRGKSITLLDFLIGRINDLLKIQN